MRDALGGIVNIVIIVVFLVIVSGYLAFNITYTKAFRVKNKMISLLEQYEGKCGNGYINSTCNKEIEAYKIKMTYQAVEIKKEGFDCSSIKGLCIKQNIINPERKGSESVRREAYYDVCATISVDIPIINRVMQGMSLFHVCGATTHVNLDN